MEDNRVSAKHRPPVDEHGNVGLGTRSPSELMNENRAKERKLTSVLGCFPSDLTVARLEYKFHGVLGE